MARVAPLSFNPDACSVAPFFDCTSPLLPAGFAPPPELRVPVSVPVSSLYTSFLSEDFVYRFTLPVLAVPGGALWLVRLRVPLARLPRTMVLPFTVRLPVRFSENALMGPVEETLLNVGEEGSLGRMTLGICLVVIAGPLTSIMYLPGAA